MVSSRMHCGVERVRLGGALDGEVGMLHFVRSKTGLTLRGLSRMAWSSEGCRALGGSLFGRAAAAQSANTNTPANSVQIVRNNAMITADC